MWFIVGGLGLFVVYLALKSHDVITNNTGGGTPNGTSTSGMVSSNGVVPPQPSGTSFGGATGRPSPLTGGGSPQVSTQYRLMGRADPTFTTSKTKFAAPSAPGVVRTGGTGVLNPLPDNFAIKQLSTRAVQPLPGAAFATKLGIKI